MRGAGPPGGYLEHLVVAGDAGAAPGEGDAARGVRVGAVHELEVQVGLGGVARVADLGEHLSRVHPVALPDGQGAAPEVGVEGVHAVTEVEDDVVAEDLSGAEQVAHVRLEDHQIGQRGQRGAAEVVTGPVGGADDGGVGHRVQRGAEGREVGVAAGYGPQRAEPRTGARLGFGDHVDGEGLAVGVGVVARRVVRRAVQRRPATGDRGLDLDGFPGGARAVRGTAPSVGDDQDGVGQHQRQEVPPHRMAEVQRHMGDHQGEEGDLERAVGGHGEFACGHASPCVRRCGQGRAAASATSSGTTRPAGTSCRPRPVLCSQPAAVSWRRWW